eukprot:2327437-Prymnesium_polylepis.1
MQSNTELEAGTSRAPHRSAGGRAPPHRSAVRADTEIIATCRAPARSPARSALVGRARHAQPALWHGQARGRRQIGTGSHATHQRSSLSLFCSGGRAARRG